MFYCYYTVESFFEHKFVIIQQVKRGNVLLIRTLQWCQDTKVVFVRMVGEEAEDTAQEVRNSGRGGGGLCDYSLLRWQES